MVMRLQILMATRLLSDIEISIRRVDTHGHATCGKNYPSAKA